MRKHYFTTSQQHILAELERIDLFFRLQVVRARQFFQFDAGYQGPYFSEHKLNELLAQSFGTSPLWATALLPPSRTEVRAALVDKAEEIRLYKAESKRRGIRLRLDELRALFKLSSLELDIFLFCLAPDFDLLYGAIYAYLQDDVIKTKPSVDLVSTILCPSLSAKLDATKYFSREAPLCKYFLVNLLDDPSHRHPTLLDKYLKVDERLVHYLLDVDIIDAYLMPHICRSIDRNGLEDAVLPADLMHRLEVMIPDRKVYRQASVVYLQGPFGLQKQLTAEALCRKLGLELLIVDLESLLSDDRLEFEKALRLVRREALLLHAATYWQGLDSLLMEDKRDYLRALLLDLKGRKGLTFLAGKKAWDPVDAVDDLSFVRIELSRPDHSKRLKLRTGFLDGNSRSGVNTDTNSVPNKIRFSGGQIRNAAATAGQL